ncbi:hypothetical protein QTP70_005994 [Hemibagrus guttatus]|uniref:Uncharacterized protein n=1 Tax=Hemibagrus guttatus TaxID=175788 RepID=A0AAE0RJ44_9TELE|nr:hypothetical protein QTP70_005994 [Hemibagrus guttatus]
MDVTGLIGRLPSICDGTQKWITWFEEQTAGQHLALGDIKALLSQTLGKAKMTEILDQADLKKTADDPHYDHHPLGPWRTAIWDAMRKTYPTKTDPGKVEKVKLWDDVGVAQFILKLQTIWREEMDAPWDETAASQALFKVMLKRALPSEVSSWSKQEGQEKKKEKKEDIHSYSSGASPSDEPSPSDGPSPISKPTKHDGVPCWTSVSPKATRMENRKRLG